MTIFNVDIRQEMLIHNLKYYEVAKAAGINPCTLSRWLRFPLKTENRQKIIDAIAQLTTTERSHEENQV